MSTKVHGCTAAMFDGIHNLRRCGTAISAIILLVLTGCESTQSTKPTSANAPLTWEHADAVVDGERGSSKVEVTYGGKQIVTAGFSIERRPIEAEVIGHGHDVVMILATIHGNEWAGTPLVQRLSDHLHRNPQLVAGRTVVLVPVANPDGFETKSRFNKSGVDLNRNFLAFNRSEARKRYGDAGLSEPESRAIAWLLDVYPPNRVISIHQPVNCIDYDGPAKELAEAMAAHTDIPVKKIGARPGSLGSYVGEDLGIPIITLELPKHAERRSEDDLWQAYGDMLLAAVKFTPSGTVTAAVHDRTPPIDDESQSAK